MILSKRAIAHDQPAVALNNDRRATGVDDSQMEKHKSSLIACQAKYACPASCIQHDPSTWDPFNDDLAGKHASINGERLRRVVESVSPGA